MTYKSYEDVFNAWFDIRKTMYVDRINRLEIMTRLRIKFMENIIRFVEIYKELKISYQPEDVVLSTLNKHKFAKFTKSPEGEPKYVPTDQLIEIYTGEGSTYNYLVSLATKDMYVQQLEKYKKQLEYYKSVLKDCKELDGMFLGAKWWLRELDQFTEIVKEGRKTEWRFENMNYYAQKKALLAKKGSRKSKNKKDDHDESE